MCRTITSSSWGSHRISHSSGDGGRLAERLGRVDQARVARHHDVVASYDLPDALPPGTDLGLVVEVMARGRCQAIVVNAGGTLKEDGRPTDPSSGIDVVE